MATQVESKEEIQQLKKRCNALESGPSTRINHVEVEYEPLHGSDSNIDESVLIVGGFDGSSWLLAMGSYSPSRDQMESLSAMTFVRQYTSAAKSNGELYIFGGVFGDHCYDTGIKCKLRFFIVHLRNFYHNSHITIFLAFS